MSSKRYEFSKIVKREALKRSKGFCEATGKRYGFDEFHRCNRNLSFGVAFDHWPLPAYQEGSNTLENCIASCKRCNDYANNKFDTPRAAKEKRIKDRHAGVTKSKWNKPWRRFNGDIVYPKDFR